MRQAASRADVCPAPCRVLARRRVGTARVQVLEQGRGRRTAVFLFVRVGRESYAHLLGANGPPGFGSLEPIHYSFDRVEPIDIDGRRATPEIAVLSGYGQEATATVCRLAPDPCCLFDMVAATDAGRPVAPSTDGQGNLLGPSGPIPVRFCGAD